MPRPTEIKKKVKPLTEAEMEQVSTVFHQFETGVRSGRIKSVDLLPCMKSVGMNPNEQELVDMTNEVEKKGEIYFKDFCMLVLRKFREEDEEEFIKVMFKCMCGTDPHPVGFRAKKYKVDQRFIERKDFLEMMQNLPEPVDPEVAEEMFDFADKDKDKKIGWEEFQIMINPPPPPKAPTPHKAELKEMSLMGTLTPPVEKKPESSPKPKPAAAVEVVAAETAAAKEASPASTGSAGCGSKDSESDKHRKACNICQAKEVKPVVETDISRAAKGFAEDATNIKYSWRNEKATFKEKLVEIATEKVETHMADHLFAAGEE